MQRGRANYGVWRRSDLELECDEALLIAVRAWYMVRVI